MEGEDVSVNPHECNSGRGIVEKSFTIGVDPGSKVSGLALLHGNTLVDWKLLKVPAHRKPVQRCWMMGDKVEEALIEWQENIVSSSSCLALVEIPGAQNRFHSRGLVTLGMVCGTVLTRVRMCGYEVNTIEATKWTKLHGKRAMSKEARASKVASLFQDKYDLSQDPGMDGADAIGLAAWLTGHLRYDSDDLSSH